MPRYGTTFAISALRRKRAKLAGEIERAERLLVTQRAALTTVDGALRLFDPNGDPTTIPSVRPVRKGCWFKHGEQGRLCVKALREASGPLKTRSIVLYALHAKGYPTEGNPAQNIIHRQMRLALRRLAARGIVQRVVAEPDVWWELVCGI